MLHEPICVTNRLFFINPFASPTGYFSWTHLRHQPVIFHDPICVTNLFALHSHAWDNNAVVIEGPMAADRLVGVGVQDRALDSIERLVGVTLEWAALVAINQTATITCEQQKEPVLEWYIMMWGRQEILMDVPIRDRIDTNCCMQNKWGKISTYPCNAGHRNLRNFKRKG